MILNEKTVSIRTPANLDSRSGSLAFRKEYNLVGILASLNWNSGDHILGDDSIVWLGGPDSEGADFKGISCNGRLVACEVKREASGIDLAAFCQCLKGAQQAWTFLRDNELIYKPIACDIYCVAPGNKALVENANVDLSNLRAESLMRHARIKNSQEKVSVFDDICNMSINAYVAAVEVHSKQGALQVKTWRKQMVCE